MMFDVVALGELLIDFRSSIEKVTATVCNALNCQDRKEKKIR